MADVNILIDVATKNAIRELDKLEKEFGNLEKDAKKAGEESDKSFSIMSKGAAAAAVAVAAIGAGVTKSIAAASKLQDLETQFIAFTGSAEGAADQVERIAEFSGQTPFQLEDLANANRTLLAFGSSTEESFRQLKQLGEAAAGTGNNIGELAQIFGQIQVAGKLTGERFNQLAERGVNLGPALAQGLGVAESELEDLRRKGQITSEDVAKAFASMTEGGGQFAGSMQRLSQTFSGATSTLSDNIDLLAADIGKVLLPAATELITGLTKGITTIRAFFNETKPEKLRQLNSELKDAKNELASLESGALSTASAARFFNEALGRPVKTAEQLKAQIAGLEKQIVDVATAGNKIPKPEEAKEEVAKVDQESINAAKKLNDELENIRLQRQATEKQIQATEREDLVIQLDARRELILQKEAEKNIAILEQQGQFEEAALAQAEESLRRDEVAKAESEKKKIEAVKKAKAEEFDFRKRAAKAELAFEQETTLQKIQTAQQGLSIIAGLQTVGSRQAFEVGKAAAVAQAALNIPTAASNAFTVGAKLGGPVTGAAFAAVATAVQIANLQRVASQQPVGFADGGLVTGGTPGRDSVPALLTPGEVVVPEKNFKDIGLDNTEQISLLKDIKALLESGSVDESKTLSIDLILNDEVLANSILELNRDNKRLTVNE